jgi:hypothetical protein
VDVSQWRTARSRGLYSIWRRFSKWQADLQPAVLISLAQCLWRFAPTNFS